MRSIPWERPTKGFPRTFSFYMCILPAMIEKCEISCIFFWCNLLKTDRKDCGFLRKFHRILRDFSRLL